jgi:hypothetical protein
MDFDLIGRVQNTRLRARHGLMPLFETVANSIAAIEEAGRGNGRIEITIERDFQQSVLDAQFNRILPVKNFIIEDNGIGFTEDNYASFDTMDSRAKAIRGGKGIGRLLWLKAFDYAEIESVYLQGSAWHRRNSTVVICHARVRMLPLGHSENADQDKGVRDGIAACGPCAGGYCACRGLP